MRMDIFDGCLTEILTAQPFEVTRKSEVEFAERNVTEDR
jgi:hypothetical protein